MLIDVSFFVVMLVAIFKGYSKGLVLGIFSLLAFVFGLAAALKLSAVVAHYFENSTGTAAKWLPVLSFLLVFLVVALLVNLAARIIKKTISLIMLGWADKIGGILFYVIIYTIIFSVILFFAEKTLLVKPEVVATSSVHQYVSPWGPKVINNLGRIIPLFKNLFEQLQDFFESIGKNLAV